MDLEEFYDVIIVGAGPAGIFAALELVEKDGLKVLILEKGPDIDTRACPSKTRRISCLRCSPCNVVSGWGGAGAFSDGKLTLSPELGGILDAYVGKDELLSLVNYVDSVYLKFGAPQVVYGGDEEAVRDLQRKATLAELKLVPSRLRHLGTGRTREILQRMKSHLKGRVDIEIGCSAIRVLTQNGRVEGVGIQSGCGSGDPDGDRDGVGKAEGIREIRGKYVIVAPGRDGAEWLAGEAGRLGLSMAINPVDIGVRVELPAEVTRNLTDVIYEPKLIFYSKSFDDKVRTFCVCPSGEVVSENNDGLVTVNGHSHAEKKTDNTNFALLVSKTFTEPFRDPIAYGKYVARLANLLGGGVIVQRLGDLLGGRRSTKDRILKGTVRPTLEDATPGDLSLVFPYRHLINILEMMQALDTVSPGVYSRNTLLYGVEVKFYSSRLELSSRLETKIRNLFAVGDGAGVTRGLMQASASGVVAAREILRRGIIGQNIPR